MVSVWTSCTQAAAAEDRTSRPETVGHGAMTSDSPPVRAVQSVSVTNGTNGCSSLSRASRTVPEHRPRGRRSTGIRAHRPASAPWPVPGTSRRPRPRRSGRDLRRPCRTGNRRAAPWSQLMTWSSRSSTQRSAGVRSAVSQSGFRGHRAVHHRELGGVEQLGAELARTADPVLRDGLVGSGVGAAGQGEPHRVGAVLVDPGQRIDAVALRLGHLLAVLVTDETVQRNGFKRHAAAVRRRRPGRCRTSSSWPPRRTGCRIR